MTPLTESIDAPATAPSKNRGRRRSDVRGELPPAAAHDAISFRAYELFLERGGEHGHDIDDWLTAERELMGDQIEATALTRELNEKPAS